MCWQLKVKQEFVITVALIAMSLARQGCTQGTLPDVGTDDISYTPLFLVTNGAGSIVPFQSGQMLEVGQDYEMEAIPGSGSVFSSWQPVNVFTFTEVVRDSSGVPNATNTSAVVAPVVEYVQAATLTFTMQPDQIIYDVSGVRTIIRRYGWQANFVPVPEPSSSGLIACGLISTVYFRRRRLREGIQKWKWNRF